MSKSICTLLFSENIIISRLNLVTYGQFRMQVADVIDHKMELSQSCLVYGPWPVATTLNDSFTK